MELGKFGADRGAAGEIMDDKGRRGVGRDAWRGNACWEVGAKTLPEVISFKATGTEFSPVHCVLVVLLVLVHKV